MKMSEFRNRVCENLSFSSLDIQSIFMINSIQPIEELATSDNMNDIYRGTRLCGTANVPRGFYIVTFYDISRFSMERYFLVEVKEDRVTGITYGDSTDFLRPYNIEKACSLVNIESINLRERFIRNLEDLEGGVL